MSVGCVQTEHCGHRLRGGSGDTRLLQERGGRGIRRVRKEGAGINEG